MRAADRQAQLRRRLGRGHARRAFEHLPLVLDALARVVIARIDAQLTPTADGEHGAAQHDQWPQRLELGVGEARPRIEPADRAPDDRHVVGAAHEVGEQHRQLGCAPRGRDVAEVDDPVPAAAVAHDVVGGEVAVDHLARKLRRDAVEFGGGPARSREALLAAVFRQVADELLDDGERVAEFPLQVAVGVVGIHPREGLGHLGDEFAELFGLRTVGVGDVGERLTVDDLEPGEQRRLPVVAADRGRAGAARGGQHLGREQAARAQAIGCRDVQRDRVGVGAGVEDLHEHACAVAGAHEEVPVLLAAEFAQRAVDAVLAEREGAHRLEVDLGSGQQPVLGHREHVLR